MTVILFALCALILQRFEGIMNVNAHLAGAMSENMN
jgi:hypothetical protein